MSRVGDIRKAYRLQGLMRSADLLWLCDEVERLGSAIEPIERFGGIDGAHHKQWVLDQVARRLTGEGYANWIVEMCAGEDGPDTYEWDEGVCP